MYDAHLINLLTLEKVSFQFLPELSVEPESQFHAIASMGRNTPHYHFTGAEDTIKFTLNWVAYHHTDPDQNDRTYVIKQCKTLEAWSKNNGDHAAPPVVKLVWGDIFQDSEFIVVSAKYTLKTFSKPHNLKPIVATQDVVLKRVSDENLTTSKIRSWQY